MHRYTELFCGGKTHLANDSGAFVVIAAVVIKRGREGRRLMEAMHVETTPNFAVE